MSVTIYHNPDCGTSRNTKEDGEKVVDSEARRLRL